jgi:hypothetical protein
MAVLPPAATAVAHVEIALLDGDDIQSTSSSSAMIIGSVFTPWPISDSWR